MVYVGACGLCDWGQEMRARSSQCSSCASPNIVELIAETCFRFAGLNGLKVDPILVYPKTIVCLDCGFTESNLAENELEQLRKGSIRVTTA
jgi:hypothetical protein